MNKSELLLRVADSTGISIELVDRVISGFLSETELVLGVGDVVRLPTFGVFTPKFSLDRIREKRGFFTKPQFVSGRGTVKFRPSKHLNRRVTSRMRDIGLL